MASYNLRDCLRLDEETFENMKKIIPLLDILPKNPEDDNKPFTYYGYTTKVLVGLDTFRREDKFCDVEIAAGRHVMKAHRVVLSTVSPYFHAMFTTGLAEENQKTIELRTIAPDTLPLLVNFIYTGRISIDDKNVQDLMIAADVLELKEVVDSCSDFFRKQLDATNALGIFRFADSHNFGTLKHFATNFIFTHFPEISREEEFIDLPKDLLLAILGSEHLKIDTEVQVFHAALQWITHRIDLRRQYVFEVLGQVRLLLVPHTVLDGEINRCADASLKVALRSVRKDLVTSGQPIGAVYPRRDARRNIYIVGGYKREIRDGNTWTRTHEHGISYMERYDTHQRRWFHVGTIIPGRRMPSVAILNELVYIAGGESQGEVKASVQCYCPKDDAWFHVSSMTFPRCQFGFCVVNGCLYALGGWTGVELLDSIERYDPIRNEWTVIDYLPQPQFSMAVVSHCGLIYIIGGCTGDRRRLRDVLSYNPLSREWRNLPSLAGPRYQMGVAVDHSGIYCIGGSEGETDMLDCMEMFSFSAKLWKKCTPMKVARANPCAVAANGLIYVIGGEQTREADGYRSQVTVNTVECYNPITETWHVAPPLPQSRSEAGAVVV